MYMSVRSFILACCGLCLTLPVTTQAAPKGGTATSMVYALPQTRLEVQLNVRHTVYKRGPYADYANRMLGIQNLPATDRDVWEIVSADISTVNETDNRELRTLSLSASGSVRDLLQITAAGLVADAQMQNVLTQKTIRQKDEDYAPFMNFTGKEQTAERVDTFYKTIMNDTAFIRQPVVQRTLTSKSREELARDVANQIYDIRDNRIQLLIGNVDNYPDGEALRTALQALSHEEELLLSMFVGARYEEIIPYRFSVVPETPDTGVLCYFSPQQGVSTAQRNGYDAISYLISTSYDGPTGRPDNNPHNLIYRTPVQCEVQVYSGSGLLQTKSLPFFQFGPYSVFPL